MPEGRLSEITPDCVPPEARAHRSAARERLANVFPDWFGDRSSECGTGPLRKPLPASRYGAVEASWRSGHAEDCKSLHAGSIPAEASNVFPQRLQRFRWCFHRPLLPFHVASVLQPFPLICRGFTRRTAAPRDMSRDMKSPRQVHLRSPPLVGTSSPDHGVLGRIATRRGASLGARGLP